VAVLASELFPKHLEQFRFNCNIILSYGAEVNKVALKMELRISRAFTSELSFPLIIT
jgi:hypothetical protein